MLFQWLDALALHAQELSNAFGVSTGKSQLFCPQGCQLISLQYQCDEGRMERGLLLMHCDRWGLASHRSSQEVKLYGRRVRHLIQWLYQQYITPKPNFTQDTLQPSWHTANCLSGEDVLAEAVLTFACFAFLGRWRSLKKREPAKIRHSKIHQRTCWMKSFDKPETIRHPHPFPRLRLLLDVPPLPALSSHGGLPNCLPEGA